MDFREAWRKVSELEGETFRTESGDEFRYRFKKTYLIVEAGGFSIPRTNFEKVFRGLNDEDPASAAVVQGQKFIRAIFADPRFQQAAGGRAQTN